jgi:RNase H-like domain found in reverse transcriptase/Reverse transcriptase (RNA-dependent DNA polymerase)/Integrase zinc binding domain
MSEETEKRAREFHADALKALNGLANTLSGGEERVTDRQAAALKVKELAEVVAKDAAGKELSALNDLSLREAAVAMTVKDSRARAWIKSLRAKTIKELCEGVAKGVLIQFGRDKAEWGKLLFEARLEDDESPVEFQSRLVDINKFADEMCKEDVLLTLYNKALAAATNRHVSEAAANQKSLAEAAAKAQAVWQRTRDEKNTKTAKGAKVAAAAAVESESRSVGAVMEPNGCFICGKAGHQMRTCPRKHCFGCGKEGHFLNACKGDKQGGHYPVRARTRAGALRGEGRGERRRAARVAAAAAAAARKDRRLFVRVAVGGIWSGALVDGGAECSVLPVSELENVAYARVAAPYSHIEGLSSSGSVKVICGARTMLTVGKVETGVTFAVVKDEHVPDGILLGADVLEPLGLMSAMRDALEGLGAVIHVGAAEAASVAAAKAASEGEEDDRGEDEGAFDKIDLAHLDDFPDLRDEMRRVLKRHREAFLKEGRLPKAANIPPVVIRVQGPPVIVAQRPWNEETAARIAEHERLLVRDGVARWVSSSAWRGEPLLVWKPDKTTRYTGDYRKANKSIVMDAYPTASLPEELRRMARGTVFSGFDFSYGFWQVPVEEGSQEPSTQRSALGGLLVFERLPMGYNTSPALFTRAVREHVIDALSAEVRARTGQYMDDLGHSSEGERRAAIEKEIEAVDDILTAVEAAGFALKLRKCKFAVSEMTWCGFKLSADGRLPDPDRTRAFLEMGVPGNKAELQRWLGVAGSLRHGVIHYAHLAGPLHARTHKKAPRVELTDDYLQQLEAIKEAIRSAPPMEEPRKDVPLTLEVDGSKLGYGAVLKQSGKVCAVASRAKTKAELNYGSFDNEWAAVVFGVEAFTFWLAGRTDTIVESDLKGLVVGELELHAHEDSTGRRARWVERLARHKFEHVWVPREKMVLADALAKSPAFRKPILELREEAVRDAKEKVRAAGVASGRGAKKAQKERGREERELKKAREEEAQRAQTGKRTTENSRRAAMSAEEERRRAVSQEEAERKAEAEREELERKRKEEERHTLKESDKKENEEKSGTWTPTKAWRLMEKRRKRRERRKAKRRREAAAKVSAAAAAATASEIKTTVAVRATPEEWREAQMKDPKLKRMIEYIEGKTPDVPLVEMRRLQAQAEHLSVREGVLGHINKPSKKKVREDWEWTAVVPAVGDQRRKWFDKAHAAEGGHMRHGATYARLISMVYWDSMWADCVEWCKGCVVCDLFAKKQNDVGDLQPTTTAALNGKRRLQVDLAGPFPADEDGNTYWFIAVDREDHWTTYKPMKDATANSTTRVLCEIASDEGVAEVLISDQGSNFTAKHAEDFYSAMGIEARHTAPEAAWSNGAAEAAVKIAKAVIKKLVEERRKMWSKLSWLANMVSRSRELSEHGSTAFENRFGRRMRTPASFDLPFDDIHTPEMKDLKKLKEKLERKRDEVAAEMKRKFDNGKKKAEFKKNDLVWIVPREKKGALEPEKIGPFKVAEVLGPVHLKVEQVEGGPPLGQRGNVQSVRNLEAYKHKAIYKQKEMIVKQILGHSGKGRGRKYRVLWEDGSESMEPRKQLVDKDPDGEETINAELEAYWARNPKLTSKS